MLKTRNKLIPDIVGHVPREISRFIWFFFTHGGKMEVNVLSVRPLPSQIPSGGLEIMPMAKLTIDEKDAKILKYLQQLITENYEPKTVIENDETDTETNITDQSHENEKEEGRDIDDLIFIDDDTNKEEEEFISRFSYVYKFRYKNIVFKKFRTLKFSDTKNF